jgi:hypothetical protein
LSLPRCSLRNLTRFGIRLDMVVLFWLLSERRRSAQPRELA